jgi:hypothetical protein
LRAAAGARTFGAIGRGDPVHPEDEPMWRRGRGALGGAAAAWVLAVGCGDRPSVAAGPDQALRRDLRLAAANAVALAGAPADSTRARFSPAAVESQEPAIERERTRATRDVAPPRARRRLASSSAGAQDAAIHVSAPATAAEQELLRLVAASAEPQAERMARFADQDGLSGYAAGYGGVALRGGAVGDDHCERDLPRRSPSSVRTAVGYRPAMVRLGVPTTGPRPGVGPLYAPPF